MLSRHCILGWSLSLNGSAPPLDHSKLPKVPVARGGGSHFNKVLGIVLSIGTVVLVLAVVTAVSVFRWRRIKYAELREDWEDEFGPQRFSCNDLFCATGGFTGTATGKQLLGAGGFGRVYKGVLPGSNLEVAVKRMSHDSRQGIREFVAEITSIGRLQHRNLVRLLGYCRRKCEFLLVYEYMSNGSLDRFLYDREIKHVLDWCTRFQIVKDIALGLFYLHNNCMQVIIHRDIKASNVLLDERMSARLGDFGLARPYDHGANPQTTRVVGTIGYLAPQLARTSKATTLTDVFAFGVFLLEVACGRRSIEDYDARDASHVLLVDWMLERYWSSASLAGCADARLHGKYDADELLPVARPTMLQVVPYLDGTLPLPELQEDGFDDSFAWVSDVRVRVRYELRHVV